MNGALIGLTAAATLVGSAGYAAPSQKSSPRQGGQVVNVICLPVEAKPADVTPGKIVHDSYQLLLGSVELVGSDNAVVTGEYGSLRFPLEAFGKWCDGSLVLKISPQRFKKVVAEQRRM